MSGPSEPTVMTNDRLSAFRPAKNAAPRLTSTPSSQRNVGLTATTALKRSGRVRNACAAKRPPNECPQKIRNGSVR